MDGRLAALVRDMAVIRGIDLERSRGAEDDELDGDGHREQKPGFVSQRWHVAKPWRLSRGTVESSCVMPDFKGKDGSQAVWVLL